MMNGPIDGLLSTLHLTDTGARTTEDIFTGPSKWMPHGRVFGGQVLAQSLIAAMHTVPSDRPIHSMHSYFLRPGDVTHPITFSVDRLHDGHSFTTRRTHAFQHGVPILSLIASFQRHEEGLEHAVEMPEGIPDPEGLPTTAEVLGEFDHDVVSRWSNDRAFDVRHIPSPIYISAEGDREPRQAVWMKAFGRLPDDPKQHRAALAYASDYSILEPVLRAHGVPWATRGLKIASLDHAMWWHRDARVDEWLLFVQESPSASGGRGLSLGRIYTRDGVLVASVAQEGMIRIPARMHPTE